jgi:hypothetical protein
MVEISIGSEGGEAWQISFPRLVAGPSHDTEPRQSIDIQGSYKFNNHERFRGSALTSLL